MVEWVVFFIAIIFFCGITYYLSGRHGDILANLESEIVSVWAAKIKWRKMLLSANNNIEKKIFNCLTNWNFITDILLLIFAIVIAIFTEVNFLLAFFGWLATCFVKYKTSLDHVHIMKDLLIEKFEDENPDKKVRTMWPNLKNPGYIISIDGVTKTFIPIPQSIIMFLLSPAGEDNTFNNLYIPLKKEKGEN